MKNIKIIFLLVLPLMVFSCKDFLDVEPVAIISDAVVIEDDESAEAAVLGMYSSFQGAGMYGEQMQLTTGLLSDEMDHTGSFPTRAQYANNTVTADNVTMRGIWTTGYRAIFIANTVLERVPEVGAITPAVADQVMGEAYFGRAWAHLNMVNLFGDIPIVLTTSLDDNKVISRSSVADVYTQIISDLVAAEGKLPASFGNTADDKTRATSWAAKAMLARVYLYNEQYGLADTKASEVISGPFSLVSGANYVDIFLGGSSETILEVFASPADQNGLSFLCLPGGRFEHGASPSIANKLTASVGNGDVRGATIQPNLAFPGAFYCNKYTDLSTGSDKPIVLRLSEMHLIRAEALLMGSGSADADLNMIKIRAGIPTVTGATIDDIIDERELELSFEGHRWFDLIRTGKIDAIKAIENPTNWDPAVDKLLPIPQREIEQNRSLTQNPGYGTGG